jgi:hypothetical protein
MSHVLVNGKWVWITQGTAPHPPEQSAEEVHNVKGRSLAQIQSRLFELTGTLYLKYVIHLQVNPFSAQNLNFFAWNFFACSSLVVACALLIAPCYGRSLVTYPFLHKALRSSTTSSQKGTKLLNCFATSETFRGNLLK